MGGEFAQFIEWRFKEELCGSCCNMKIIKSSIISHESTKSLYLDSPAFWEQDNNWMGFEWNQADDYENSVYIYTRVGKYENQIILVILNLTLQSLKTMSWKQRATAVIALY